MFARPITRWSGVDFDDSPGFGVAATKSKILFNRFLLSYELNPRTALFIGYADNRANRLDLPDPADLIPTACTLFAKIGHARVT